MSCRRRRGFLSWGTGFLSWADDADNSDNKMQLWTEKGYKGSHVIVSRVFCHPLTTIEDLLGIHVRILEGNSFFVPQQLRRSSRNLDGACPPPLRIVTTP